LSRVTENEGYKGRWFNEWDKNERKEKVEKLVWAAYNNPKSFWLCRKELRRALEDAGFSDVFEQFNFTGDIMSEDFAKAYNRSMFIAIKA
jgi:hypothetical protein